MKYSLNFNDLEEYKEVFQNKIDEFNEEIYKVFLSCQKTNWVGIGHDRVINAIYNQIEELDNVSQNLTKFIDFLNKALEAYTDGVKEVDTKFLEMREAIEAEKIKRGEMPL